MSRVTEVPAEVLAGPEQVLRALTGGYALVTVRSKETGRHVTLKFTGRVKGEDGRWISRASNAGRVGLLDGDVVEVRDPDLEYEESYVGRRYRDSGEVRVPRGVDPARGWTARALFEFALGERPSLADQADVYLATQCCRCGRRLTDPVSVERGIGPECYGKETGSRVAEREAPADPAADRLEEKAAFAAREREQERAAFESDPDHRRLAAVLEETRSASTPPGTDPRSDALLEIARKLGDS